MAYEASTIIKTELRRRNMTYKHLAWQLEDLEEGWEDPANIANTLSRGGMSAAKFLKYLSAIGCKSVQIAD